MPERALALELRYNKVNKRKTLNAPFMGER